jgi:hypothetical protein
MYLSWDSLRLDFVSIFYLSPKFVRRRSNSLWWMSIFDLNSSIPRVDWVT